MTQSLTVAGEGPNRPQEGRQIPLADLPVYPILLSKAFKGGRSQHYPNITDSGMIAQVTLARYAMTLALKLMDIRPGQRVLLPAYHCSSMVHPVVSLEAEPAFYRIRHDLAVDFDDLIEKIDDNTRVVIATHFFGFPQDMVRLRALCDRRQLFLLEDCAHAFFGMHEGEPLGSFGDYAVASFWKFFPLPHGACLTSNSTATNTLNLRDLGLGSDLRALVQTVGQANYYGAMGAFRPVIASLALASRAKQFLTAKSVPGEPDVNRDAALTSDSEFNLQDRDITPGAITKRAFQRMLGQSCDIAQRRRHNYLRLLEKIDALPACRPLFTDLPDHVVPFMFPLWIEQLTRAFPLLEDAAVPMQRFGQFLWPGVDQNVCPISSSLSNNLLQLPCHQDLEDSHIDAIVHALGRVLTSQ